MGFPFFRGKIVQLSFYCTFGNTVYGATTYITDSNDISVMWYQNYIGFKQRLFGSHWLYNRFVPFRCHLFIQDDLTASVSCVRTCM